MLVLHLTPIHTPVFPKLNIASSSVVSSRMSLNQSSDEDDDDDFGDAISIVHGITPSKTPGKKGK